MRGTTHCVNCGSNAIARFGGHVHKGTEAILSGWCLECFYGHVPEHHTGREGCAGCDGEWQPKMGIQELEK